MNKVNNISITRLWLSIANIKVSYSFEPITCKMLCGNIILTTTD